jgi:hypothetical protein
MDELSQMSVAQAIQESMTSQQLLYTAQRLWLPTDPDLPIHFKTQKVHHDRRIKAASMLLFKLGDCIGCETGVELNYDWWGNGHDCNCNPHPHHQQQQQQQDQEQQQQQQHNYYHRGLKRAILASSMEFHDVASGDCQYNQTNGASVCMALVGIYSIIGYTLAMPKDTNSNGNGNQCANHVLDQDIQRAILCLIQRAESVAWDIPMHHAVEVRWAIRGILARLGGDAFSEYELLLPHGNHGERLQMLQTLVIPNLQRRTEKLPFDILPMCLDWDSFHTLSSMGEEPQHDIVETLLKEIPFHFDTITTKSGSKVEERRGTAWVAEEGIGSLAYSGKLMAPHRIPEIVQRVMRQVEQGILDYQVHEKLELCRETLGTYFDCALCNHYPNEESKCKFHTDPEHGTYWERLTCVVSAGNRDVRKFAFRPIPNENDWDSYDIENAIKKKGIQKGKTEDGIVPAVIPLFPGDAVIMDHECNDLFHHAVYGRQDIGDNAGSAVGSHGRVSLVLKRAMDLGNGRKGHGKVGQGRRSKRM